MVKVSNEQLNKLKEKWSHPLIVDEEDDEVTSTKEVTSTTPHPRLLAAKRRKIVPLSLAVVTPGETKEDFKENDNEAATAHASVQFDRNAKMEAVTPSKELTGVEESITEICASISNHVYSAKSKNDFRLEAREFLSSPSVAVPLVLAAIVLYFTIPRKAKNKDAPPMVKPINNIPLVGRIVEFGKGPLKMVQRCYEEYGPVYTVPMGNQRLTFLIGPEAQEAFCKANDEVLSQDEVYQFMKPVFGPGVVYDATKKKRQVQFTSIALFCLSIYFACVDAFTNQTPSVPNIRSPTTPSTPVVGFFDPLNLAEGEFWGDSNAATSIGFFLGESEIKQHGRITDHVGRVVPTSPYTSKLLKSFDDSFTKIEIMDGDAIETFLSGHLRTIKKHTIRMASASSLNAVRFTHSALGFGSLYLGGSHLAGALATGFTAPMTKEYILLQGGFHTLAAIAGTLRINWKVERPRILNFASAVPFAAWSTYVSLSQFAAADGAWVDVWHPAFLASTAIFLLFNAYVGTLNYEWGPPIDRKQGLLFEQKWQNLLLYTLTSAIFLQAEGGAILAIAASGHAQEFKELLDVHPVLGNLIANAYIDTAFFNNYALFMSTLLKYKVLSEVPVALLIAVPGFAVAGVIMDSVFASGCFEEFLALLV